MTISSSGSILVWSDVLVSADDDDVASRSSSFRKEFVKSVKVGDSALRVIRSVDGFVMVSDVTGQIRFYDKELIIVFWCPSHDSIDSVIAVEFNLKWPTLELAADKGFSSFPIRDFLVRKFSRSSLVQT